MSQGLLQAAWSSRPGVIRSGWSSRLPRQAVTRALFWQGQEAWTRSYRSISPLAVMVAR